MGIIKSEYALMFDFLKQIKKLVLILALIFVAIAVISYFVAGYIYQQSPEAVEEHIGTIAEMLNAKDIIDKQGKMDTIKLFLGNFYAAMAAVSYGMLPFLFLPAISVLTNASVIGVMTAIFKQTGLGGVFETLVGILPHGIFEIPALLISVALGLRICFLVTRLFMRKSTRDEVFYFSAETARTMVLAVVPLLLISAVIESHITPIIMDLLIF